MPRAEEQKTEAASRCPECRHGDKDLEASIARHEHYLSFARVHGVENLRRHLIEQHGEDNYKMVYANIPRMIDRKLTVEAWKMEK